MMMMMMMMITMMTLMILTMTVRSQGEDCYQCGQIMAEEALHQLD